MGETTQIETWREGPRQDPEKQPHLVDRWQRRGLHRGMSGGLTREGRSVSRWKEGDPVTDRAVAQTSGLSSTKGSRLQMAEDETKEVMTAL